MALVPKQQYRDNYDKIKWRPRHTCENRHVGIATCPACCEIPEMTDPLGKSWDQPDKEEIVLRDGMAWMSPEAFEKLAVYSFSDPTALYLGKMWRAERDGQWWLRFVTKDRDDNEVIISFRIGGEAE